MRTEFNQIQDSPIPNDWSVRTLGEIGQCLIGLTYDPKDISANGVLVLRASNIDSNTLQFGDDIYVEMDIPERINVREGDLLICVRNGSRPLIGKCALIDRQAAGMTFGAFMSVFRSKDSRFVSYCFQSDIVKRQIHEHLGATINQITNKSLNSFEIPYPGSRERTAIAEVLSDVDGLLAALDRLIDKKRAIKQAAMQQLLTGETRLPGFSGEWGMKRLGEALTVKHGRSHRDVSSPDGKYPILSSGGEMGRTDCFLYDKQSVLIGRKGTIDDPQFASSPFWTVDTLFYTEIADGMSAKFLYYVFCTIPWRNYNEASGVPSLNARTIESIEVRVPDTGEQHAIATVLSDIDAEIAALGRRRDKTRVIKQGMMQELLTGRVRLVEPEPASEHEAGTAAPDREGLVA